MKSKKSARTRLFKLYTAAKAAVARDKDRQPRIVLDYMSRRFTFNVAQSSSNHSLTGAVVNVQVYHRLVRIAQAIYVCAAMALLTASLIVAMRDGLAATVGGLVLLVCFLTVAWRVGADIDKILNLERMDEFMRLVDETAERLNSNPITDDQLRWLRCSVADLIAAAERYLLAKIGERQFDEAQKALDLFVGTGLVLRGAHTRMKARLQEAREEAPVQ